MKERLGHVLQVAIAVLIATSCWADNGNHERGLRVQIDKSASLAASTNAPDASGSVQLSFAVVNGRTNESLRVKVDNVPLTNATLQVMVTLDGSTNAVSAGAILTDGFGDGKLFLRTKPGPHHTIIPVPAGVDPTSAIIHVDVLDASSNVLLSGDIGTSAPKFKMHALARLSATSGKAYGQAGITAKSGADAKQAMVINASKLPTNTPVQVQVNGTTVDSPVTRKNGKLNTKVTIPGTIDPARILSIQIIDASTNTLLSATLPQ